MASLVQQPGLYESDVEWPHRIKIRAYLVAFLLQTAARRSLVNVNIGREDPWALASSSSMCRLVSVRRSKPWHPGLTPHDIVFFKSYSISLHRVPPHQHGLGASMKAFGKPMRFWCWEETGQLTAGKAINRNYRSYMYTYADRKVRQLQKNIQFLQEYPQQ